MAKLEKQIEEKLSSSGKAKLEEEVKYLGIIRQAVEYHAHRDPNETDGLLVKKSKRIEDVAQKKAAQKQAVKEKSFRERLAEKRAEADRINAGRSYHRNIPVNGREER